jgi:hypothetical protein
MALKEILRRARRTSGEGSPDRGEYREAADNSLRHYLDSSSVPRTHIEQDTGPPWHLPDREGGRLSLTLPPLPTEPSKAK